MLLIGILCIATFSITPNGSGAARSFTLRGNSLTGWGQASGPITSPGPTITVDAGDSVTLTIVSDDGSPHNLLIDYDGDRVPDAGEPLTLTTSTSTVYTFTASQVGSFTYWCAVHFEPMFGSWVTQAAAPGSPSVSIQSPAPGDLWTGGTDHEVRWSVAGLSGASYAFWVNYTQGTTDFTLTSGNTTVVSNSTTLRVPGVNTTAAVINITALSSGNRDSQTVTFSIDSIAPAAQQARYWINSDGKAVVSVKFSEPMKRQATPSDVGVKDGSGGWVSTTTSWFDGDTNLTLVLTNSAPSLYTLEVNTTFRDKSDPGNTLATRFQFSFAHEAPPPPEEGFPLMTAVLVALPVAVVVALLALLLLRRRRR